MTKKYLQGKLIRLLQAFTKKELKHLELYISAPFFNTNLKVVELFRLLKVYHPLYEQVDKERLFKELFPEKKTYKDAFLRALTALLSQLVMQFMAYQEYEGNKEQQAFWLLENMNKRRLEKDFELQYKQLQRSFEKAALRNPNYYFWQFRLAELNHLHITLFNNRTADDSLQEVVEQLDIYYVVMKLQYRWLALNRQRVIRQSYHPGLFFEEMKKEVNNAPFDELALVQLYDHTIALLQEPEQVEHFEQLKTALEHQKAILTKDEQRQIYTVLINYCRWQFSKGASAYMEEALGLYQCMLNGALLHAGAYISPHHFKNMVTLALQTGKMVWVEEFMETYWQEMHPAIANNVYCYNKAAFYFHQQKYKEAATLLRQIQLEDYEFIDFYYHINYKVLLIKTYYETGEEVVLEAALDAFRIYLIRHTVIGENQRVAYMNFIKLVRQLLHEKWGKRRSKMALSTHIQATKPLYQGKWLLEKSKQLPTSN